jgi:hypothetical protein
LDGKGVVVKKNPRMLKKGECGEIELEGKRAVCAELFSNFKALGRVILRDGG